METSSAALESAIKDHLQSQSAVARIVGVTPQAVSDLIRKGRRVPAEWCIPLEEATGGKVTRHQLRPDLYPIENGDVERQRTA